MPSLLPTIEVLLAKVIPVPLEWLSEPGEMDAIVHVEEKPCHSFADLREAWEEAMEWTEGLDVTLASMLATIVSTNTMGDQLWLRVISPPACLHKDTIIYDPIDASKKTAHTRFKEGKQFHVHTKFEDGTIGVGLALPPHQKPKAMLYKISLSSGREIIATGEHKIWNGKEYLTVSSLNELLGEYVSYPLPTILDTCQSIHVSDAYHCFQTPVNYQDDCSAYSHQYDEQLHPVKGNDQVSFPLQDDVQECTQPFYAEDDYLYGSKCNLTYLPHGPQPSCNSFLLLESFLCGNGLEFSSPLSISEQFYEQFSSYSHIHQRSIQKHKVPLVHLSEHHSKLNYEDQHQQSSLDDEQLLTDYNQISYQAEPVSTLDCKGLSVPLNLLEKECNVQQILSLESPIVNVQSTKEQLVYQDSIVSIVEFGIDHSYDFQVPDTNNYLVEGLVHHNSGKSTLCDAISANTKHVVAKSNIRGFLSGHKSDKEGSEDNSLIAQINHKTLVTKDGDTLMQSPNVKQTMAEARDLYDGNTSAHYRHKLEFEYHDLRITWILCGTSGIHELDDSELGERFLDCVLMSTIDDDFEDKVLLRVAEKASRSLDMALNLKSGKNYVPEMMNAIQLTAGYISWLKTDTQALYEGVANSLESQMYCAKLGKFVAHMRANSKAKREGINDREFGTRLVSQLVRYAKSLAVVMNELEVNETILKRAKKIALDTGSGPSMNIVELLVSYDKPITGQKIAKDLNFTSTQKANSTLRFLKAIGVVEEAHSEHSTTTATALWKLTPRMEKLYQEVHVL